MNYKTHKKIFKWVRTIKHMDYKKRGENINEF